MPCKCPVEVRGPSSRQCAAPALVACGRPVSVDRVLVRTLLAAVAGVALSLAYPPVGCSGCSRSRWRRSSLLTVDLTPRRAWVPASPSAPASASLLICWMRAVDVDAWLALSALETLFYGLLGAAVPLLQRRPPGPSGSPRRGRPWRCCAAAGRSAGCRGAGWPSPSSTPRWPTRCRTSARSASASLLALFGTLLAALVVRRRPPGSPHGVGLGLLTAAAPAGCPPCAPWTPTPDGELTVAAVQGDVPGNGDDILYDFRQVTQNHVDATVRAGRRGRGRRRRAPPDFVLWPENSTAVDPFADAADQHRDPGRERGDRRTDPGRRHRRRRSRPRAQPGHRVGPGDRRGRPLHQAPPGAVRRVHPAPRNVFGDSSSTGSTRSARHASAAPGRSRSRIGGVAGRRRDLLRRRVRRRALRPGPHGAELLVRADAATRRSSTPTRSTSSSRSPGCARSRPAAGSRSPRPTASPGVIAPGRQRRRHGRPAHPGACWRPSAWTPRSRPAIADRALGRAGCAIALTVLGLLARRCSRIVGRRTTGAGTRTPRSARDARATRPARRAGVTGEPSWSRADLGRVVMVIPTYNEAENLAWIVGRLRAAAADGRRPRRRRQLARRHRRDRRRAGRRRPRRPRPAPHRARPASARRTSPASRGRSTPATT